MSFSVEVYESDSCAICQKPGSNENPMVVLNDTRRRRGESSYISFHVEDCWPKALAKAAKVIKLTVPKLKEQPPESKGGAACSKHGYFAGIPCAVCVAESKGEAVSA